MELEQELLQDDTQMPVYAAFETPELMEIYEMVLAQSPSTEIHSATEGENLFCCRLLKLIDLLLYIFFVKYIIYGIY